MPPAEMYHPEGMSAKKKEEFEQWYIEKVNTNFAGICAAMEICETDPSPPLRLVGCFPTWLNFILNS